MKGVRGVSGWIDDVRVGVIEGEGVLSRNCVF